MRDDEVNPVWFLELGPGGGFDQPGLSILLNAPASKQHRTVIRGTATNEWRSDALFDGETARSFVHEWDFTRAAAAEISPIMSMGSDVAGTVVTGGDNAGSMTSLPLLIGGRSDGTFRPIVTWSEIVVVGRSMTGTEKTLYSRALGAQYGQPFSDEMAARDVTQVLWMGQSNAAGYIESTSVIEAYNGPHEDPLVRAYKSWTLPGSTTFVEPWAPLKENPGEGRRGPDLTMATEMFRHLSMRPEIIMSVEGGTSLAVDWAPGSGANYIQAIDVDAPTALGSRPVGGPVDPWVVWIQGESDASTEVWANTYGANLAAFIAAVRANVPGYSTAKWIIAMLHLDCALGVGARNTTIRNSQIAVAAADARVWTVETSDLALQGDGLHYTEAAAITLGKRIATTIAANREAAA